LPAEQLTISTWSRAQRQGIVIRPTGKEAVASAILH